VFHLKKSLDEHEHIPLFHCITDCFLQPKEHRDARTEAAIQTGMARILAGTVETSATRGSNARRVARCSSDISQSQLYNTKIAGLIRQNAALEDQLATALASKDQLEKSLSSVILSREQLEKMLAKKDKEAETLKEKVAGLELAQEESNSLSNTVHADNVCLEREVAFLKAVTDETQKARPRNVRSWLFRARVVFCTELVVLFLQELHSTRRVLAGEQSRAFQLQVIETFFLRAYFYQNDMA
jgi:hypothetical protein